MGNVDKAHQWKFKESANKNMVSDCKGLTQRANKGVCNSACENLSEQRWISLGEERTGQIVIEIGHLCRKQPVFMAEEGYTDHLPHPNSVPHANICPKKIQIM